MNYEKNKLVALSAVALSLPGMIPSAVRAQDALATEQEISYRYSHYSEGAMPSEQTLDSLIDPNAEDVERYKIDVHQLRFASPVFSSSEIAIDMLSESMSGASPRYVVPVTDNNGDVRPIQVMSGATIEEQRSDIDISLAIAGEKTIITNGIGYSVENDYNSIGLNTKFAVLFNNKNTVLEFGFSVSKDNIDATQDPNRLPSAPLRATDKEKTSGSASIGLSQILSKSSVFSTSINFASYSGYLSDPYKSVYLVDNGFGVSEVEEDSRPGSRNQWAWSNQYRQHFSGANGSLHIDYRYFYSDWETASHTVDLRWAQELGSGWTVIPAIRYYDQSAAAFFQNWYEYRRADGYYSSDYRLSDYNAVSAKLKIIKRFSAAALHFSYESYSSEAGMDEPLFASPALVDFAHISIGFDVSF